MAKIRSVTYERLFTLTQYNNERISLTAEIEDKENPDIVFGKLFHKATQVHKFFAYYRSVLTQLDYAQEEIRRSESQLASIERGIEDQKISIAELTEKLKEGDLSDERMRHACAGQSLKSLNEQLEREKHNLAGRFKRKAELETFLSEIDKRVKEGNLTLENLKLPSLRLDTQDNED
jgi:uncharacterized protein YaaN involved in tellurite resistance